MDTLRVGVIGTGGIGAAHVRRVAEFAVGATVTAVNDVNEPVATKVAESCGARFEKDPHALINAKDVDAVIIASWDRTHEEFALACIAAKKYVLCEKPLATSSEGCRNIMDAEIKGGRRYLDVGFMRRNDRWYRQLKEAVDSGEIGRPLMIHAQHRNKAPQGEKHTTEMSAQASLVHEFDICRWLLDDEYESIQLVHPRSSKNADPDLIDPQIVYLTTRNGVRLDLEMFMNGWYGYDVQCEVVAENASVRLPDPANIIWRKNGMCGYAIYPGWAERFADAYAAEIKEWVANVKAGKCCGASAWDGYMASLSGELATRSRLEGGAIVKFPDVKKPDFYK